jgi:hypothetical protein
MASTVLYMSISLDGFVAGPNESWDENPLGDDGGYLHGWFPPGVVPGAATSRQQPSEDIKQQIFDELMATSAIVAGAGTFDRPAAGAAITTMTCRSSSSVATSLGSTSVAGRS